MTSFNVNLNYREQTEEQAEAASESAAELYFAGQPDVELEYRNLIPEADVETVSAQDLADLAMLDDLSQHSYTL